MQNWFIQDSRGIREGDHGIEFGKAFSRKSKERIQKKIIDRINGCHSDQSAFSFFVQPIPSSTSHFPCRLLGCQHRLHHQRRRFIDAPNCKPKLGLELKINLQEKKKKKQHIANNQQINDECNIL